MSENLRPPYFLVALPRMDDEMFRRTVVLIVSHDAGGAFGLILNKALMEEGDEKGEVAAAVMKAEIKDRDGNLLFEFNEELFDGGPLHEESVFLMHDLTGISGAEAQVGPENLFVTSDPQVFQKVLEAKSLEAPGHFPQTHQRYFLGCSSWIAGQLDHELRSGSWIPVAFKKEFLFEATPKEEPNQGASEWDINRKRAWQDDYWKRVLRASGVDPLTVMAQSSDDSGLN